MSETTVHINPTNKNVVTYADRKYLIVAANRELRLEKAGNYSAIIIDAKDIEFARLVVRRLRGNFIPEIYLKPILLMNTNSTIDAYMRDLTDGKIYSIDQIALVHPNIEEINNRIKELQFTNSISIEAQIISKLLGYMYTRQLEELNPIPYVYSSTNYSFPLVAVNFKMREESHVFDILKTAEEEGLLSKEYHDRIYLCSNCNTGHLSFRETCTQCVSSNTDSFDVVHHFPCAYVGPITDFTNELDDQLDCPKCNKRLKHIGVDYDKPSVLHLCNNCGNRFQDFNVHASCMNCQFDNHVEQLVSKEVNKYFITKKGEISAISGYVSTPKDIEQIIGTVKFDTFKTMVKYEIERLRQTEGSSNLVAINIKNAGQVYSKVGSKAQQSLLKDMVAEIRHSIRSSDMITFKSSSVILIAMNEIPRKIASRIMNEILDLLRDLIQTNFKNLVLELESQVSKLDYNLSADLQIQQLTKDF